MTSNLARGWITSGTIALLLVGISACSAGTTSSPTSSAPTTASPTSSPVTTSAPPTATAATPSAVPTYCALLATAYQIKPPTGVKLTAAQLADEVKFGKLLIPASQAAAADGKPEVAKLLTLLATMNSDPTSVTAAQAGEAFSQISKVSPTVMADCKINLMQ